MVAQIKIACIGDSITYGKGISRDEAYPARLQQLLGADWDVRNFGVSGCTLLSKGDFPYINERAYADAKTFDPNIAIIMLGTNDAKPQNWKFRDDFVADYSALITELRALPAQPKIIVCLPVPACGTNFSISEPVVNTQIVPLVKTVASENKTLLVDLHTPLTGHPEWFQDMIHPTKEGAEVIANVLAKALKRSH